jgi:hypothetical protein
MKTRVLARITQERHRWSTHAYQQEGVFCSEVGSTETEALKNLRSSIEQILATHSKEWLNRWRGQAGAPNCPEGAVKIPIDLWVCKLVDQTCPLQAQVVLDEPERFFEFCLAASERKQQIFDTVASGKYGGFHHLPGRYLCVRCEETGTAVNFQYHYPWELTLLKAYHPFSIEHDLRRLHMTLLHKGVGMSSVSTALCARHCKDLAEALDLQVAGELRVLEFEISR